MLEKATDAHSGARELCLSVPFLLYNCTDLLLTVTEISYERSGSTLLIPCSFELDGHTRHVLGKNGLSLVSEDPSIQSVTMAHKSIHMLVLKTNFVFRLCV